MTDEQTWMAACERVGVWQRGERCSGCMDPDGHYFTGKEIDGEPEMVSHDIPCPPISEPAAVLKMLEYLKPYGGFVRFDVLNRNVWIAGTLKDLPSRLASHAELHFALAAAVNALSESQVTR